MNQPYNNSKEFTIEKGCPWYEAQQTFGSSNLNLCEKSSCTYLDEPVNTLSNLLLIFISVLLIKLMKRPLLKIYGLIGLIMGVASFVYHATNNSLSQYIDFFGMFLLSSFLLNFHLLRFLKKDPAKVGGLFWFVYALHVVMLLPVYFLEMPIQYILLGSAVPVILLDILSGHKEGSFRVYKFAKIGLALFAFAQTMAIFDAQKIYCNPENLFLHGHVLWHIFGALGILSFAFHIKSVLDFLDQEKNEKL